MMVCYRPETRVPVQSRLSREATVCRETKKYSTLLLLPNASVFGNQLISVLQVEQRFVTLQNKPWKACKTVRDLTWKKSDVAAEIINSFKSNPKF